MTILALPTREIVRALSMYDPIFSFYENGLHGVIEESIACLEYNTCDEGEECDLFSLGLISPGQDPSAISCVIHAYENYVEAMMRDNTYTQLVIDTYAERIRHIQLAVEAVNELITNMMDLLLRDKQYEVKPNSIRWIGDDVFVQITFFK